MNFLGRGLTFLFLGCLVLVAPGDETLKVFVAAVTLLVAFAYIILWCITKCGILPCSLPPPFMQSDVGSDSVAAGSPPVAPSYDDEAAPAGQTQSPPR